MSPPPGAIRASLAPASAGLGLDALVVGPADATVDGRRPSAVVAELPPGRAGRGVRRFEVLIDGWRFEIDVESETRARLRERATRERPDGSGAGPAEVRAIIPGRVLSVAVAPGDAIEAGQPVLVIEAMKMQNELRAPRGGVVERVAVGAGETVELGDLLLVLAEGPSA